MEFFYGPYETMTDLLEREEVSDIEKVKALFPEITVKVEYEMDQGYYFLKITFLQNDNHKRQN